MTISEVNKQQYNDQQIQDWLAIYLGNLLDLDSDQINFEVSFEDYGLDSSASAALISDLETSFGLTLKPDVLVHFPSIQAFSSHLVAEIKANS
jgi:acyl carrier protein